MAENSGIKFSYKFKYIHVKISKYCLRNYLKKLYHLLFRSRKSCLIIAFLTDKDDTFHRFLTHFSLFHCSQCLKIKYLKNFSLNISTTYLILIKKYRIKNKKQTNLINLVNCFFFKYLIFRYFIGWISVYVCFR